MLEEQRKPSNVFMEECTIGAPMLEEQRKPSNVFMEKQADQSRAHLAGFLVTGAFLTL